MKTAVGLLHEGRTRHHLARIVCMLGAPLGRWRIALISSIPAQRPLDLVRGAKMLACAIEAPACTPRHICQRWRAGELRKRPAASHGVAAPSPCSGMPLSARSSSSSSSSHAPASKWDVVINRQPPATPCPGVLLLCGTSAPAGHAAAEAARSCCSSCSTFSGSDKP